MRLLGLTNFYPPLGYGYGAICRDVMEELQARGHQSTVLCVQGGTDGPLEVRTGLGHVPAAWRRPISGLRAESASQRLVAAAIAEGVDAALVWHMRGVGKGSLTLLHRARIPVLYLLGDLWVLYERPGPPAAWRVWSSLDRFPPYRVLRGALGQVAGGGRLELRAPPIERQGVVCFASRWLADRYAASGFQPQVDQIVPNGIRTERFARAEPRATDGPDVVPSQMTALFAGRLDQRKGPDLAVDAIRAIEGLHLVLAGGGTDAQVRKIRQQIAHLGLEDRVTLTGELSRDEIAALMRDSDIFLMPARDPDAFGLVYVEAMAAGAVVLGTARGGAAEICRHGENCLVVGETPAELADALARVCRDPTLREQLRAGGAETARRYTLEAMVDRLDRIIEEIGSERGLARPNLGR